MALELQAVAAPLQPSIGEDARALFAAQKRVSALVLFPQARQSGERGRSTTKTAACDTSDATQSYLKRLSFEDVS